MSRVKHVANNDVCIYVYDGTFPGFLCCVYESVYSGIEPYKIVSESEIITTLFPLEDIVTDIDKADRVLASIPKKISLRALELVRTVFLSCLPNKELCLLQFLLRGYREGGRITSLLGDADVAPILKAEKNLLGEAHLLKGFLRFADYGGMLAGTISPKNFVLPFIAEHFILRYDNENFLIYDKTHGAVLRYFDRNAEMFSVEGFELADVNDEELRVQSLWKQFYNTVAIAGRENPKCRMTHMPKRYWENMLEVRDLL